MHSKIIGIAATVFATLGGIAVIWFLVVQPTAPTEGKGPSDTGRTRSSSSPDVQPPSSQASAAQTPTTERRSSPSQNSIPRTAAGADTVASNRSVNASPESSHSVDPRLTYETIYRNVRPEVRYVGDTNCAQCHQDLCDSYHLHAMGRSAIPSGSDGKEPFGPEAGNPSVKGPYILSVAMENGTMVHRIAAKLSDGTELPPVVMPVPVAIGSGSRGRSYLQIDGETVWQSPLSWYSTNNKWDVSPGYDLGYAIQRPIVTECLNCHVNQHDAIADTVNRYRNPIHSGQLAIGCERCHGPGELHSIERTNDTWSQHAQGKIDTSIVNPAHLSNALQMSICAQCHLSGKERVVRRGRSDSEFRPGMPFELFATAFLAHPDAPFRNKAVSHFDQSALAKCRTASGEKLLCTSCHDPHKACEPEVAVATYNQQCNACHATQGCTASDEVRQAKQDNCIGCHMPQSASSNIPHTSLTDHRIRRDPSVQDAKSEFPVSDIPLILYAREGLTQEEIDRDLGIALSRFAARQAPQSPFRKEALDRARTHLAEAVKRWPNDAEAWIALSETEKWSGNMTEALNAAENGLKHANQNEDLLVQIANLADATGASERSLAMLSYLVNLVPNSHDYRIRRMLAYVAAGQWDQAEEDCKFLLNINPLQPSAHLVLGMSLYGNGQKQEGRRELLIALELATSENQRKSFQAYFDRFVAWRSQFGE